MAGVSDLVVSYTDPFSCYCTLHHAREIQTIHNCRTVLVHIVTFLYPSTPRRMSRPAIQSPILQDVQHGRLPADGKTYNQNPDH